MTESEAEQPPAEPTAAQAAAQPPIDEPVTAVPGPSPLGIWAFVLAVLGVIGILPIVGSVLGLVLGRVALRQARTRSLTGGRGLAIAAVAISVVTLVLIAFAVAAYALAVAFLEI